MVKRLSPLNGFSLFLTSHISCDSYKIIFTVLIMRILFWFRFLLLSQIIKVTKADAKRSETGGTQ